jgi:hypothetical protein
MPHQPTRLPYGISYVKPGVPSNQYTFTAGDVTPDVAFGTYFITGASSLTITNFDGGERGKVIYVYSNSGGATTIQNSAGGIRLTNIVGTTSAGSTVAFTTAGNALMLNGETLQFAHNGTEWSMVGPRFVLSTQV